MERVVHPVVVVDNRIGNRAVLVVQDNHGNHIPSHRSSKVTEALVMVVVVVVVVMVRSPRRR